MDKTTQFLHALKALAPDGAYSLRSKELIARSPQAPRLTLADAAFRGMESLRLTSALVLTSALILLILGGLPYLKTNLPLRIAGLDTKVIRAEEREIHVVLEELSYYDRTAEKARAALNESLREGPGQLSPTILKKEAGATDADEPFNDSIDAALRALTGEKQ